MYVRFLILWKQNLNVQNRSTWVLFAIYGPFLCISVHIPLYKQISIPTDWHADFVEATLEMEWLSQLHQILILYGLILKSTKMFLILINFVRFVLPGCFLFLSTRLKINYDEADGTAVKTSRSK